LPFSSNLPFDVDRGRVDMLDQSGLVSVAQREFDILSWQAFIALNWPADASGNPDATKKISDPADERVWNYWRNASTVFRENGEAPDPWGAPNTNATGTPELFRAKAAWRQDTAAGENFQAFSGPLVDQHGKWARYEVLINHEEFDYLVKNELYSLDGQVAFSQKPDDNMVTFPTNEGTSRHGAIEIKLAWKELDPKADDASRFITQNVQVRLSEPARPGESSPPTREIKAGLVGMHIAMRTASSPEWIWATFEQIDNVRVNKRADGSMVMPSFYNPRLASAKPNILPRANAVLDPKTGRPVPDTNPNTATTWIEHLTTTPVQVERVAVPPQGQLNPLDKPIADSTADLNVQVQEALSKEGSALRFYELIGTQWPIHPNAPAFAGGAGSAPESITHKTPGDMVPVFLVNTTMETYFQKGRQPAGPLEQDDRLANGSPPIDATMVTGTESCVGCHYSAGIAIGFKKNDDGTDKLDGIGRRIPIFGENGHFGRTGNGAFSWLLQIEAQGRPVSVAAAAPPRREPAAFLNTTPRKN
jgi:hypothetical protein